MILLVCWHRILGDGVYFDDFDIETGRGINVTEEEKAHGPTGTRTHTMRALGPDDRPVTFPPAKIDTSPNLLGTVQVPTRRDCPFAARSPSTDPH